MYDTQKRNEFNKAVNDRKCAILDIYGRNLAQKDNLSSERLNSEIDKVLHPEKYETPEQSFFDAFDEFLIKHPLSDVRKKNFRVVIRALHQYELYTQQTVRGKKDLSLLLDTITADTLQSVSDFLKNEHVYYGTFSDIYEVFPEYHEQKPRGQNTINDIMTKIRTFFLWCVKNKKTENRPFDLLRIDDCVYGTSCENIIKDKLFIDNNLTFNADRTFFIETALGRLGDLMVLILGDLIEAEKYGSLKSKKLKTAVYGFEYSQTEFDIMEKRIDEIDIFKDRVFSKNDMGKNLQNNMKQPKTDTKTQPEPIPSESTFESYLHHPNKEALMGKLRELLKGKKGKRVATVIKAMQETGFILNTEYISELHEAMKKEFGAVGSGQGITGFLFPSNHRCEYWRPQGRHLRLPDKDRRSSQRQTMAYADDG